MIGTEVTSPFSSFYYTYKYEHKRATFLACNVHTTEQHLFLRKRNFTQNSPAALIHCAHCEQCTGCARWGGESCTTHRTHSLDCLAKNWVQSSHTPLSRLQGTRRPFKAKHLRLYCIQSYMPSHSSYGLWFWSFKINAHQDIQAQQKPKTHETAKAR